jgi:hypothetical protein
MRRNLRRVLAVAAVITVAVGLVAFGVRSLLNRLNLPHAEQAKCDLAGTPYSLSTEQAANAATVSAVATTRKLPRRATVIALATALQESKLVNVEYGDRDSVGLFQQRPSQGWGSAGQILDPRYSAGKFYDALVKVKNWQHRPITQVAQAVQQSGHPEAYSNWEDQATVMAKAFSGTVPAAITCVFPSPTVVANPGRVVHLLSTELPTVLLRTFDRTGEVRPAGWVMVSWLVAHGDRLGIDSVTYAGQRWSRADGWRRYDGAPADRVRFEVAEPRQKS